MDAQANVKAAKQFYADFKRGDIDSVPSALAEDVDWGFDTVATEVPRFRIWKGRSGVRELFGILGREMDDGKITNVREFVDTAAVLAAWRG